MTYNRPGQGTHEVNNTADPINHGDPVSINGHVGVAVKQKERGWDQGLANRSVIDVGEKFWIVKKGIVQVNNVAGLVDGDEVYIAADGTLSETVGGEKFGRVVEVVGDGRGVPTGKVRIDLDAKDSF